MKNFLKKIIIGLALLLSANLFADTIKLGNQFLSVDNMEQPATVTLTNEPNTNWVITPVPTKTAKPIMGGSIGNFVSCVINKKTYYLSLDPSFTIVLKKTQKPSDRETWNFSYGSRMITRIYPKLNPSVSFMIYESTPAVTDSPPSNGYVWTIIKAQK